MVNKGSNFAGFTRFPPHTNARAQRSMPPLWAAIIVWDRSFCTYTKFSEKPIFLIP